MRKFKSIFSRRVLAVSNFLILGILILYVSYATIQQKKIEHHNIHSFNTINVPKKLIEIDKELLLNKEFDGYMQRLYEYIDVKNSENPRIQVQYFKLYNDTILHLLNYIDNPYKANIVIRPYFSHWIGKYIKIINYLKENGYKFKSISQYVPGDEKSKIVFLRYDLHLRDVPPAYGIIDVNTKLGINADYFIQWRYSDIEINNEKLFLDLRKFESPLIHWGLHPSPFDTWLISEKFNGESHKYIEWRKKGGLKKYLNDLYAKAKNESLQPLIYINDQMSATLKETSRTFREHFPNCEAVAAHGSSANREIALLIKKDLEKKLLKKYLNSVDFLTLDRVNNVGFIEESYNFYKKHHLRYITDSSPNFIKNLKTAVQQQKAMHILIHPAQIQKHDNWFILEKPISEKTSDDLKY